MVAFQQDDGPGSRPITAIHWLKTFSSQLITHHCLVICPLHWIQLYKRLFWCVSLPTLCVLMCLSWCTRSIFFWLRYKNNVFRKKTGDDGLFKSIKTGTDECRFMRAFTHQNCAAFPLRQGLPFASRCDTKGSDKTSISDRLGMKTGWTQC